MNPEIRFNKWQEEGCNKPAVLTVSIHLDAHGAVTGFILAAIPGGEAQAANVAYHLGAEWARQLATEGPK